MIKFLKLFVFTYFITAPANVFAVPESFADLVEELSPSVVSIASTTIVNNQQSMPQFPEGSPFDEFFKEYFDREQRNSPSQRPMVGLGSGFVIDNSGIIVTNNHVIEGADEISVILSNKEEYKAELLGRDPKADLAVLKIIPDNKNTLSAIKWGDSDAMRVGDWTIAIGNPLGLGGTVTTGIVSAISRDIGSGPYVKFIQTDASINRGNSGGPLFNVEGEVIGINTAIISQTGGSIGLGFAIPSNSAKKIIQQLVDFGRTKRGWLGVQIQPVSKDFAESLGLPDEKGAFVSNVDPNGPSKKAGIEAGDVILRFNDFEITRMIDLPRVVAEADVGSVAVVEVWRKNKIISIKVKLGELPEKSYVERKDNDIQVNSLGISISKTENNKGVLVTKIDEEVTKLQIGDIINEINREEITGPKNFEITINKIKKTGRSSLLLKVLRDEKSIWITVKFLEN
tara:strand:- start:10257 stop:11621 length:1365 start_codon:yes stop_codon:yes gene_type:complete